MPTPEDKQLNIIFDTKTTLTDLLYKSDFFVQIECRPESDGSLSSQTIALAKSAAQIIPEERLGLMATSIRPDGFSASSLETARKLQDIASRPVTMVLSGQGHSIHDLKTDAASAKSNGIVNLFAVTGNIAPDHEAHGGQTGAEYDLDRCDGGIGTDHRQLDELGRRHQQETGRPCHATDLGDWRFGLPLRLHPGI